MQSEEANFQGGSQSYSGSLNSSLARVFKFPKSRSETLPTDQYGEYKSDSQLFFTDKLEESRQCCSLWFIVVFIILTWNTFIFSLQLNPLIVDYLKHKIRCEIPELEKTNWDFDQIKKISLAKNGTEPCYYYDLNYSLLSKYTYEQAFNMSLSWDRSQKKKCDKFLVPRGHDGLTELTKVNVPCESNHFRLFYFMTVGDIIGYTASGFVADIYGRRTAILLTVPLYVSFFLLKSYTTTTTTYWLVHIFSTIAEASIRVSAVIGLILRKVLEIVHMGMRPFMVPFIWVGMGVAGLLKFILSKSLSKWTTKELQWVTNSTLLLPLCAAWLLPESPHWLLCRKDWKEMLNVLYEMSYPKSLEISEEAYRNSEPSPTLSIKGIIKTLLKPIFRTKILLGGFLYSLTYFLYYAESSKIMYLVESEAIFSLIEGIGIVINMALIPLMLSSISRPMSICCVLLVLAFFYCADTMYQTYSGTGHIIGSICFILAQNAIMTNGLLIMETFPTRVRATAIGICRSGGTIWVLCGTYIIEFTNAADAFGPYGWTIYADLMLVAAFLCIFVSDTGNVPLPDTELQAIVHF